jgi:hypothetical protein
MIEVNPEKSCKSFLNFHRRCKLFACLSQHARFHLIGDATVKMEMGSTVCNLYYPFPEMNFRETGHPVDTDPLITTTVVIYDWPIRRQKQ